MPWQEYGSRQTATPPYAGTRSMMAEMAVSAYSTAEGVRLKKFKSLQMQINSNVVGSVWSMIMGLDTAINVSPCRIVGGK